MILRYQHGYCNHSKVTQKQQMTQSQQNDATTAMTQYQQLLHQQHHHYHVAFTASAWFAAMSASRQVPGYVAKSASGCLCCKCSIRNTETIAGFAASVRWVYCNRSIAAVMTQLQHRSGLLGLQHPNYQAAHVATTASSLGGLGFGVLTAN